MKVFYTCSYFGKKKYQKYYDMVLRATEATGTEVISPEKGNYKDVLSPSLKRNLKDEKIIHHEAIKRGILTSDAVIIEASHESFQLGYEAGLAIFSKKHLLCLSIHENFSDKMKFRYLKGAKYNEWNVEEIVENFINFVKEEQLSERFNLFLSPNQVQYLEKSSQEKKINKSEYLRNLIDKDQKSK